MFNKCPNCNKSYNGFDNLGWHCSRCEGKKPVKNDMTIEPMTCDTVPNPQHNVFDMQPVHDLFVKWMEEKGEEIIKDHKKVLLDYLDCECVGFIGKMNSEAIFLRNRMRQEVEFHEKKLKDLADQIEKRIKKGMISGKE